MTPDVRTARTQLASARAHLARAAYLRQIGLDDSTERAAAQTAVTAVGAAATQAQQAAATAASDAATTTQALTTAQATFNARQGELPTLQDAVGMATSALDTARDTLLATPDLGLGFAVATYTTTRTSVDTATAVLSAKIDEVNAAAAVVGTASEAALTASAGVPITSEASRIAANLNTQAQALL